MPAPWQARGQRPDSMPDPVATRAPEPAAPDAMPQASSGTRSEATEAALRGAGLPRFRLIRPNRPVAPAHAPTPAPTETTVLAASVAAAAMAQPRPAEAFDVERDAPCLAAWLVQFGRTTRDLRAACVVQVSDDGPAPTCVTTWPDAQPVDPADVSMAARAVTAKKYLVEPAADSDGVRVIALPLVLSGLPRHAVVMRIVRATDASVSADLKPLLQASAWLKLLLDAHRARVAPVPGAGAPSTVRAAENAPEATPTGDSPGMRDALDLLAATLGHRDLPGAAATLANQLAVLLRSGRVSVGLLDAGRLQLLAASGSAGIESTTALSGAVRAAMEEAIRQGVVLASPDESIAALRETAAQRLLLQATRCGAVWTLPFAAGTEVIGAVTIEWPAAAPADPAQRERCASMLALAGPLLATLQRAGETPARRLRAAWATRLRELGGPRHPFLKVGSAAALVLLVLAAVVPGTHRVAGDAVLRGSVQRVVLAPVDGYVATATARPGDVIAAGDVLAKLDDQSLQLELAKWQAEYDRLVNEYRDAMSQLDSAKVGVLRAEIDRAAAEFELAEDNLARSEIRAPLAGVVVSGDFTQKIGAPVRRGDTLFELAPLDGYRIGVRVAEGDIGGVKPGQRGRLLLQSLPGEGVDIVVERVTPVSEVIDGRNVFEVEARLLGAAPLELRPGMQGVAKLDVGRARLLWLWTHRAADWLRVTLWGAGLWG